MTQTEVATSKPMSSRYDGWALGMAYRRTWRRKSEARSLVDLKNQGERGVG